MTSLRVKRLLASTAVALVAFSAGAHEVLADCGPFTDVPDGSIFCSSILKAYHLGITAGASPTTYDPAAPVTREEMAAFLASLDGIGFLRGVPPGSIVAYGGTTPPSGWLACDGASVNRSDYPALFAAIGTAYGSSSAATFNVPDFRGRFLRGVDQGAGRDPDSATRSAMNAGGNTGDNVGSVQNWATGNPGFITSTISDHTHSYIDAYFAENTPGGQNNLLGSASSDFDNSPFGTTRTTQPAGAHSHTVNGGNAETRATNAYVEWIIRSR